jgi:hypothetical protein
MQPERAGLCRLHSPAQKLLAAPAAESRNPSTPPRVAHADLKQSASHIATTLPISSSGSSPPPNSRHSSSLPELAAVRAPASEPAPQPPACACHTWQPSAANAADKATPTCIEAELDGTLTCPPDSRISQQQHMLVKELKVSSGQVTCSMYRYNVCKHQGAQSDLGCTQLLLGIDSTMRTVHGIYTALLLAPNRVSPVPVIKLVQP